MISSPASISLPDAYSANRERATDNVPALHPPVRRGVTVTLAAAASMFVVYPAIRPFSDETSLQGAAAFASTAWLLAHTVAMAAFLLLTLGLLGLHLRLQDTRATPLSLRALIVSWIGVGLTLPFYGAETFGLATIGQHAYERSDETLLAIAEGVRLGPGIILLAVGLLLLATGVAMFAAAIWKAQDGSRWSGIPLAVGLALYLPQFLAPQPVRIGHGALVALGCLLLAQTRNNRCLPPRTGNAAPEPGPTGRRHTG